MPNLLSRIVCKAADHIGLIVKGVAGQSAVLQSWRNSSDTEVAAISAAGAISSASNVNAAGHVVAGGSLIGVYIENSATDGPYITPTATGFTVINRTEVANIPFGIKGMAGQTGDLQQWKNSSNVVLSKVNAAGLVTTPGVLHTPVALTDGANIAVNAALGNLMRVTLGGNRTLDNPTNGVDGQMIMFEFKQDGTGSRTLTLGSAYNFGTDLTSITLSTAANTTDRVLTMYNSVRSEWDVIGFKKGF